MSFNPPIRCIGRRYPNAPVSARMGCLERQPSYWWIIFSQAKNVRWPPSGETMGIRFLSSALGVDWDPFQQWEWVSPVNANLRVWVFTETTATHGTFRLHLRIRDVGMGIPVPTDTSFEKFFVGGFPKWNNAYSLTPVPGAIWYGGTPPANFGLFNAYYSQIPVGRCISP